MTVFEEKRTSEDDKDPMVQEKTDGDAEMDDPVNTEGKQTGEDDKEGNMDIIDEGQDELNEEDVAPMVTRSRSRRDRSPSRATSSGKGAQPKQAQTEHAQPKEMLLDFEGAKRVRTDTLTRTTS